MPGRFAVGTAISVVFALLFGWLVAGQLSSVLAIEFTDSKLPEETPSHAVGIEVRPLAPLGEVSDVGGAGGNDDPLLAAGTRFLREAVDSRDSDAAGPAVSVEIAVSEDPGSHPEGYEIEFAGDVLTISAADRRGAGQGLFRLADAVASGHDWSDAATAGVVTPSLEHRFVDTGAVGVEPDLEAYLAQDDYQHSSTTWLRTDITVC